MNLSPCTCLGHFASLLQQNFNLSSLNKVQSVSPSNAPTLLPTLFAGCHIRYGTASDAFVIKKKKKNAANLKCRLFGTLHSGLEGGGWVVGCMEWMAGWMSFYFLLSLGFYKLSALQSNNSISWFTNDRRVGGECIFSVNAFFS